MINKGWRIFATGLCFFVFFFGGLVLAIFVLPIQGLFCKNKTQAEKHARKTVKSACQFFIFFMEITQISRFLVNYSTVLANLRGNLIIANHPSLIDVVLLLSKIPDANCIVKAHLFSNPFIRGVIRNTGYISNDDPEQLIEDCRLSLAQGHNLIIFPEGTRSTPNQPLKFKRGAANIAIRCDAPMQCFRLDVNPITLTKAEKWYKVPSRKFVVNLTLLADAPVPDKQRTEPISKSTRLYTRELEQYYNKELEK